MDPHQSEKVEAMEGHFGSLKGQNLGKVSGRIRIMQEQIERYRRIRIRVSVKGRIRIRIKVILIRNTACKN
jgi:hypothetical protein